MKILELNFEFWDKKQVEIHHGTESKFTKGIWMPDDTIINSEKYS